MTFFDLIIPQSKAEAVSNAVAVGAATSDLWLPMLRELSDTAALLAPIAGVTWLVVQIVVKLHTTYWKKK